MTNTTLNVQGMSCGHCANSVVGNVGQLDGVETVIGSFTRRKVDITFDLGKVNLKNITEVIEDVA
ncbi:heavy-metal-associated domain-containing protein [Salicibibacter cibarius]|uniref:Heavy-metal-associated domain-containing protein n=1 Tax=Salicibibacter cibarius TaxID=2743000 RepID=A0A7T6Z4C8_9BACI|nr:cation transporter [Salicibibacter cibarius]QQK76651.1 heavy-metal-associated domain-containing protein [Salicibibacter cibarius]